jgi:hypothetical protein
VAGGVDFTGDHPPSHCGADVDADHGNIWFYGIQSDGVGHL